MRWNLRFGKKGVIILGTALVILLACVLGYKLGTAEHGQPQPPQAVGAGPLQFATDAIDVGKVIAVNNQNRFVPIEVKIPFTVWEKSPVTITKITPGCGRCLLFDGSILDKELASGSTHVLVAHLDPFPKTAKIAYQAIVETSPPFAKPKIIAVNAHAVARPVPYPVDIRLELGIGDKPKAEVRITYVRGKSEPELRMKASSCEFPGFTVVKHEFKPAARLNNTKTPFPEAVDELELRLQAEKEYPLGIHQSKWLLKWEGPEPDVEIPVTIGVVHPVRPKLSEVFCGILQPAQEWKGEVPLSRREGVNSTLKAVKASQPYIQAQVAGKAGDRLEISLKAPVMPKRYQEHVEFVFDDSRYPPLRIPVVFLVQK